MANLNRHNSSLDPTRILNLVILNGETILKAPLESRSDSMFEGWYDQAENALALAFGDNWKVVVVWEGYEPYLFYDIELGKSADSLAIERLERAVAQIRNAMKFMSDVPIATPATKTGQPSSRAQSRSTQEAKIFIVHGHDNAAKLELKNYLQNTLKLPEPIILHEKPNHGYTIFQKLEKHAIDATCAFILLTPDDVMASDSEGDDRLYRARQNVILELGYFLGFFGRESGRVILLHKGTLDIPSDIHGIVYIDITNGIEAAGEKIRLELSGFLNLSDAAR